MFDSTKADLKDLLTDIDAGRMQLPEFQRSYVWNDEDVKSLIASVAKGYPVGALLTLEEGSEVKFKPRLLEGVPSKSATPVELLLDGQQRMTSLYQAAFAKQPVRIRTIKNVEVDRLYYIDIKLATAKDADIGDAVLSVPADPQRFGSGASANVHSEEFQFENDRFPLNRVFDPKNWFYGWRDHWKNKPRDVDLSDLEKAFDLNVVDKIQRYKMPIIRLDKRNGREAICLVFEKVNVGGKKLDAFELVTAIFAGGGFDLREDWDGGVKGKEGGRRKRIVGSPNRRDVVAALASTEFLQCCTLLSTRARRLLRRKDGIADADLPAVSCNRDALLALQLPDYKVHADAVERGFIAAASFLNEQKIIWHRDVPYPPQTVALAAVSAILGNEASTTTAQEKLALWFWSGVLGEQYGSSTESRLARDVPELVDWIKGTRTTRPRSLDEALFRKERLWTLRSRLSAAYKGLHALLMRHGCRDFISGKPTDIMTYDDAKIDIHHIFPQKWCKNNGIPAARFNSIINKTPLSKRSNILIGGDAPSVYLARIEEKQGLPSSKLDEILRTHLIEPELLRADDFEGFFKAREKALAGIVADAMGKQVIETGAPEEVEHDSESTDEIEENEMLDQEVA